MGDSKLCLLLLLSTSALAFAQDEEQTCLLAKRYRTLHKYEYLYEAESMNAITGGSHMKNGPKTSCKVEIEVPQTCNFIVRIKECSLSEVSEVDAEGNPVFRPAPSSDAFAAEMEKYPLKVVVENPYIINLYPEEGETTTILNIKRGIISALAVPLVEEDKNGYMPSIHGMCKTYATITDREDIPTGIKLERDLSNCDQFVPMKDYTSPLAIFSGMHYPLSKLIRSSQTWNYKFDNERKHMVSGIGNEKHILIPFSHNGESGVTNMGKQTVTLIEVTPHNDRVFDHSDIVKSLTMEEVEDKTVTQDKDAALTLLTQLATLPETDGEKRPHLFHKLVTMVRGMKAETLSPAIPEALAVSNVLTYQVLAQCGTPECSSAIMQILRTFDSSALEVDAAVFAMGLVSNPSALIINDMLEMAKFKASKPIMYALSNMVKRFYKAEEKMIPEIHAVAEFMSSQLGDCSGDKDQTFMTLRVIGNMAAAVVPASPALRNAVMQCVNQPAASMAVQQAAIQVYRLTAVPEESREPLMQVVLNSASPLQKRIAAYLVLMKDPQESEVSQLASALPSEMDTQFKSFVISHITNILSSTEPQTMQLRQRILNALQDNEIGQTMNPTKFSRNYKMGSVEGNMIFEGSSYLPKEVMLDMTLKAFGYDVDMMEVGMEGQGFEPTVEALFGPNGFFPDTALKTMYFVSDNMPVKLSEILKNFLPAMRRDRMKRQTSQNLIREVGRNFNKLVRDLKKAESPEAMVYLRLLGNEMGYLRTNDLEETAYSAAMMIDGMLKMFPVDILKALMTKTDNTFFAHYMFLDNEFFLPTIAGVPLRIALSGTFTPGVKGGLKIARDMSEVSFMPSAGVEFVTQIGAHIPEYVDSGLEMQTNIYHESGITAKVSMVDFGLKMTIPAPTGPVKFFKMTNNLVAVTGSERTTIPPMVTDKVETYSCTTFFAGLKYCPTVMYTDASSQDTAPYFPLTGDSKYAVELHPTGDVTEYTATVTYAFLMEGEDLDQQVDNLKFVFRAEGTDPTEARVTLKYDRTKTRARVDLQIPEFDVEAGLSMIWVNAVSKGDGTYSMTFDMLNKDVSELSLAGSLNPQEHMMKVQFVVPSIATVTANMMFKEELKMELKSEIKVADATSEQEIELSYDNSRFEVEFKSDMNTDTRNFPVSELVENFLDAQVGQTDMKVRHIFKEFVEALNNYKEKYGADIPYLQNFRVPDMPEMSMPEKLFLTTESKATYHFMNDRYFFTIPIPFGGKSTDDFNFPPFLTTPRISFPEYGLEIVSMEIPIPTLFVPKGVTLSIPLFDKVELSTMMKSNVYDMEASMAVGKDVVEAPSYSAMFDVKGTSPIEILSVHFEGSGMLATTDSIKAEVKSSLIHSLMNANFRITEEATVTDKINMKSVSRFEVTSPFGLNLVLNHNGMTGVNNEELSAESNFDGTFKAGLINGKTISTQSFNVFPFRPEANLDSSVQLDSTFVKAQNTIKGSLLNGELSVVSNTNAFEDALTHVIELSFKDQKLAVKYDANALALGMKIRNQAEASAGAGEIAMRMETNTDYSDNRVYSLMTATFDVNGLAVNSDANMKFFDNEATHKAMMTMNKDGLTTSGTTTLQSPLSFENTFNAGLDFSRASLSVTNKAAISGIKVDNSNSFTMSASGLDFNSKAEATADEYVSYTHDIMVDMKPYTVAANVNNNLKLLMANFINEAKLQAELYKIDLTGSMKAIYGEEELKHAYEITFADMTAHSKCSTTGKLFGTHMSHNTELEVMGLAARFTNDNKFNSQAMRFDNAIRCSVVPFDFNLDAIFNADGDLTMYGKHSAQLYGKLLVKAQPLAFASSHEYRASVTQQLDNGFALETTFDNKMDTALSLEEQRTTFRMKSKMNEHAFNQDMSVYNTAERMGMEVSSTVLTNLFNSETPENQEFTMAGFLKYDKNTNSHVIQFPLIESVPAFLESVKGFVVKMAEALQDIMNNEELKARLEAVPQHISNFVSQLNIEGKVTQLKQLVSDFTQDFSISMEDVEGFLGLARDEIQKLLKEFTFYLQRFAELAKNMMENFTLPETISQKIQEMWEEYDIKNMFIYVVETMKMAFEQMDLETLKGTSMAFLVDIDNQFNIRLQMQRFFDSIKYFIESIDIHRFVVRFKEFFMRFNFDSVVEELMMNMPTEMLTDIFNYMKKNIQDFNIIGKINTFYAKMREIIVKFEVDKILQAVVEKAVELIKQFKIDETITSVVQMVKDADIPMKFMQTFQQVIDYLKATEVKDIIQQLNNFIDMIVQKLKAMEYNDFVNYTNEVIARYTTSMNEMIKTLEIPQKLEATREFINLALSSLRGYFEQLRETKVADILKSVKDTLDQFVLNDAKMYAEMFMQDIANLDIKEKMTTLLDMVKDFYDNIIRNMTFYVRRLVNVMKRFVPDQKMFDELEQMVIGLMTELRRIELYSPSFTVPLTDLVVPSMKFSMDVAQAIEIPEQVDIPEFKILNFYTVPATTISYSAMKQKIMDLIDFIVNFRFSMVDLDAFFGDLTMNLPAMPEIAFPEFTLPEISFPNLPQVPVEKFVKTLEIPEIKLPTIPSEFTIPCFGKLYGEIRFQSPIYTVKTNAEFLNATENEMTPQFTGFLSSIATSPSFEILSYKLDSSARIAVPRMSRIVVAETLKLNHMFGGIDHQASVNLYGFSAQAQAKTGLKVTTTPYTADFMNTAFIAMEGGMSASLETSYNHLLNLDIFDVMSEVSVSQKAIARQDGLELTLTVDNNGKTKFNDNEGNHKSNLQMTATPSLTTLTFTGDTDSAVLKMKQVMDAEIGTLTYFKFNVRNEAGAPMIKNSVFVASGNANLFDMKIDINVNHDTELHGAITGPLSNRIHLLVRPLEFVFDFQNKGNTRVNVFESLNAKIDLQSDYSALFKPDTQKMNAMTMARFNQYKVFYNFTVDNNEDEAGVFVAMESEANLDFLKYPISIPELDIPFVDFRTPAVSDINLYEQTILKDILTTTEQSVDVDAKLMYKKSKDAPLTTVMDFIQIPSVGDFVTELSMKSAIINLNVNAGLYTQEDIVFRLGATTASVFEALKAKLDGTTSLTTSRGLKLANSLSLENNHIEGTHDSSITVNPEAFETAVSAVTVAKITLPIVNLEVNQNLVADTKTKPKVLSTFRITSDIDIPLIKTVVKANADHSLKMEGTFEDVSMESSTRGTMDGTMLEDYLALGVLDNEVNMYLNENGLRSTSKIIADAKLNHGTVKVFGMDVNENLAIEASLSRVYAVLKYTGNNEADLFDFNTKGKQTAQANFDFVPLQSLTADIEIDISQPTNMGDIIIFEKAAAEMTTAKQMMSTNTKFVSPVYTTTIVTEVEASYPVFKANVKSSATSFMTFLEYDMDATTSTNFENDALSMINKMTLTHTDMNMDVNHVISQALRRKRQADDSISRHTLNVDINSPTFTDMNLRYAASRNGISASMSSPSAGFLGLQINGRIPAQMNARLYGRYPSAPEVDVDILMVKSTPKDADMMNLQFAYNMEAPKAVLSEMKMKFPSMMSTLRMFADKYEVTSNMEELKNAFVTRVGEAYDAAVNYDIQLSQLSIFFRNTFVQYQKTVQVFLDAIVKLLRETHFKLPGSEDMTTVPEVLRKLTSSVATVLDRVIEIMYENMEKFYDNLIHMIKYVQVRMPLGDAINGGQFFENIKANLMTIFNEVLDFVKNMESLDTMLVKIGETFQAIVEKTQEFVDSLKSDYLDDMFVNVNNFYRSFVTVLKNVADKISAIDMEQINNSFEYVMDMFIYMVDQINTAVNGVLQQVSEETEAFMKVNEGRLEIDLPFPFQY